MDFKTELEKILSTISQKGFAVLSTSNGNHVTSRTMSVVTFDGKIAFQTSESMRKYKQIQENENVALCVNEIQIEGIANDKGNAGEHAKFVSLFKEKHPGSYETYTNLDGEKVIEVKPTYIQMWKYIDGKPNVFMMDVVNETVSLTPYQHGDDY